MHNHAAALWSVGRFCSHLSKHAQLVIAAVFGLMLYSGIAQAQYQQNYERYADRIKRAGVTDPGGPDMLGDQISLHDGGLLFTSKDVVLSGNARLPISIGRKYSAFNRRHYGDVGVFGDWELDIPRIEGVFAPNWSGRSSASDPNRCSNPGGYPLAEFSIAEWWTGLSLHLPDETGGGDLIVPVAGSQKPTNGSYPLMTSGWSYVSCLSSISNGTGQGFQVITPSGTKYSFQWMAQYIVPGTSKSSGDGAGAVGRFILQKRKNVLYVTRVEDRFGNYVTYNYSNAWNQAVVLNSITASDGREISVTYTAFGKIETITTNGRKWTYRYATTSGQRTTLTSVTQPDSSQWQLSLGAITDAEVVYHDYANDNSCFALPAPNNSNQQFTGTIKHPAGVTGSFTLKLAAYHRSNVPISCRNVTGNTSYPSDTGNDFTDDYNNWPLGYWGLALQSKTFSGPGIGSGHTWAYTYSQDATAYMAGNATWDYPVCTQGLSCGEPRCISDVCAGTARTTVTSPDGSWTRYVHGNSFKYNEGKLLTTESGAAGSSAVMNRLSHTYDFRGVANRGYLHQTGWSLKAEDDGYTSQFQIPIISATTTRDGVNFQRTVTAFDHFANPTLTVRSNSLGYTTTDANDYQSDYALWVLSQPKLTTNVNTGMQVSRIDYSANMLPYRVYSNGKLQATLTYHADSSLHTTTDGRGNVTTLTNWHRGVPRSIRYADGTMQAAVVDDNGWIRSVTDENGYSTGYGYDAMGRLGGVVYPNEDNLAYHSRSIDFRPVTSGDWRPSNIVDGQWRRTDVTGNNVTQTYYDGLWRPVLVNQYDAGQPGTLRSTRTEYDSDGRATFQSYPSGNWWPDPVGTRSSFDALGRVTQAKQDSEHGVLTTTTEYLSNFEVRITNPRGFQTVNGYHAYDAPTYDNLAWSVQPEGKTIQIDRNIFGLPTALNQRNADSSKTVTRRYVYDGFMQLCKTIEPETGATVLEYDGAGNIAWRAAGLGLPDAGNCNRSEGLYSGRRVDYAYDTRNRPTSITFPDGRGNQALEYWPDGLQKKITAYNDAGYATPVVNEYFYNRRRLMTSEVSSQPGWYAWSVAYGYSANGDPASLRYPDSTIVTYGPNALGQASSLVTNAGQVYISNASYFPNGAVQQFSYGNGVVHTMQQNARQLPERVTSSGGVLDYQYHYDGNANPHHIANQLIAGYDLEDRWMTYDGLDRLTDAGSGSFGGDHWHRIRYDALDNITSNRLPGVKDYANYVYDASNRLARIDSSAGNAAVNLSYDAQGNLYSKGAQQYAFGYDNRLYGAANQEAYRYDGQGRRVLMWKPDPNGGTILGMYTAAGQLVYEENHRSNAYTYNDYFYFAGSLVLKRERSIPSNVATLKYQHTDALGSPVAVTNSTGQVIERTQWEPYGAAIGKPSYQGPGYTGHVMDSATGLTYMQQRYYDPNIGRFLSVDPIAANARTGAGFNRYAYVSNNPYKFTDPDGRYECNGSKENCATFKQGLSDMRASMANLKEGSTERNRLERVSALYGNEGDKNGTTVRLRDRGGLGGARTSGKETLVNFSIKAVSARFGAVGSDSFRKEFAGFVGHEGDHGVTGQDSGGRNPANKAQEMINEQSAYRTQGYVHQGMSYGTSDYRLWTPAGGIDEASVNKNAEASTAAWCRKGGSGC